MRHVVSLNEQMHLIAGRDSYWVYTNSEMKEFRADTLYQTLQSGIGFEGTFTGITYDRENDRLLFSTTTNRVYSLKDRRDS